MFGSFEEAISVIKYRLQRLDKEARAAGYSEEYRIRVSECEQIIRGMLAVMEYEIMKFENEAAPKEKDSVKIN